MRPSKHYYIMRGVFLVLLFLLILVVIFFTTGCEVLKTKQSSSGDTTSLKKTDSASVSKKEDNSKSESAWWKEIINFRPAPQHDSTYIEKTNTLQPIYQIIREGGTDKKEDNHSAYDSNIYRYIDSTAARNKQSSSVKETKVLNTWQLVGLFAAVYIVLKLLGYGIKKFKIVKV